MATRQVSLFGPGDLVWVSDQDGSMLARVADVRGDLLHLRTMVGESLGWHDRSVALPAVDEEHRQDVSGSGPEPF